MKPAVLRLLICPACKDELGLRTRLQQGPEVVEGTLACRGCGAAYPIRKGVPRFVADGTYASSFGFQWHWFRTAQLDSVNGTNESGRLLQATTGWTDEDYAGRLVLDAGAGAGRFAEIVAGKGGEVVGIDLTTAVDAAYLNVGRYPNVHLVQTDMFAMPFREETFDLAYAIGVLHHTPDPRRAFTRVAATVKKGGGLAIYVYGRYGPGHCLSDAIRVVTTRLPLRLVLALSALAVPLYHLHRMPGLGRLLRLLCPISMHPNWRVRWLDTFDWYTPTYQWKFLYPEVYRWFRANRFQEIEIFDHPIRMRGTKAG